MASPLDRLFVYGTLHPGRAPAEIASVVSQFVSLGRGTVRGRLHHFPDYPALRLDPHGEEVQGAIFQVPAGAWPALDAYEGYNADAPGASLFLRVRTSVACPDGATQECWIYTYARSFPAA